MNGESEDRLRRATVSTQVQIEGEIHAAHTADDITKWEEHVQRAQTLQIVLEVLRWIQGDGPQPEYIRRSEV